LTPAAPPLTIGAVRGLRLLAAAGVLALASRVSGESLGEAAAREQARRDAARRKDGPAAVVHEEELKSASGRIANDPTIRPAVSLPRSAPIYPGSAMLLSDEDMERLGLPVTPYVKPAPGAQDDIHAREAYWREEARRRRQEAAAAEDVLKDVERWSDPTYAGKDKPSCPITRNTDRRKARADAARARESLKALDEEARVGGALPGWVRE
jgi:hypothetical protein